MCESKRRALRGPGQACRDRKGGDCEGSRRAGSQQTQGGARRTPGHRVGGGTPGGGQGQRAQAKKAKKGAFCMMGRRRRMILGRLAGWGVQSGLDQGEKRGKVGPGRMMLALPWATAGGRTDRERPRGPWMWSSPASEFSTRSPGTWLSSCNSLDEAFPWMFQEPESAWGPGGLGFFPTPFSLLLSLSLYKGLFTCGGTALSAFNMLIQFLT